MFISNLFSLLSFLIPNSIVIMLDIIFIVPYVWTYFIYDYLTGNIDKWDKYKWILNMIMLYK
jgi:hypothetical protein